ncbi:PREDICTED: protein TIFY 11B-like isoform X2 [Camelina sativa]|uniref:Protein TIFY n=1 Tax=Camelina sativa TaxID=90675 RepID=A0ABM1R293_CAMSA|nr:PREDICTED: protein TIFY 11B-like isoform X1 [Camelina sativa]XP_019093132.1 PREDICTED: protein TIFY 11B-like isoform X2 [Camelina sativa]
MSSTGQAPEKSNFSQRCSLLSRYLKEKGSFGNINIGLARKSDLELAGNFDLKGQQDVIKKAETSGTRSFDLIQKVSNGEASTSSGGKAIDIIDLSELEPGNSQLTIFFGGKVMVFNEFPEDKAKEIMQVAAKAANHVAHVESKSKNTQMNLDMDISISSKSNVIIPDLNEPTSSGNNEDQQTEQQQHQGVERIARRASLHRFFAKRKDRAVARAPYQVNQNGSHLPPKPEMVSPSIKAGQSSRHFATPPKPKAHN